MSDSGYNVGSDKVHLVLFLSETYTSMYLLLNNSIKKKLLEPANLGHGSL